MEISIKHDLKELTKKLNLMQKEITKITVSTINSLSYKSMLAEKEEAKRTLDKPKPYTIKGIRYEKATLATQSTNVYITDEVWKYLRFVIEGGTRTGGSWGTPKILIPAEGSPLDKKYGGMNKKWAQKIIATTPKGLTINAKQTKDYTKKLNKKYFFGTVGGVTGYWQRDSYQEAGKKGKLVTKTELNLLIVAKDRVRYTKKLYKFGGVTKKYVDKNLKTTFEHEYQRLMAKKGL